MNNLEGLSYLFPTPICWRGCENTGKVFICFIEKHYAQSKAKQSKNVHELKSQNRIHNLLNNDSYFINGSVLPGAKTLTCTLVVSIRPPRLGS